MRAWQTAVVTGALAVALACATACTPEAGTPALPVPLVAAVTATATVDGATATATAPAVYVHCTEEDGSGPGQIFPCLWSATVDGNGRGQTYILAEPAGPGSGYELPGH